MVANGEPLPRNATVIFYVKKTSQLPKDGGPCTGIDIDAIRCDSDGISVTWIEFFGGNADEHLRKAAHALRGTLTFKKSGILAQASVGDIIDTMMTAGREVTVCRDVVPGNDAHCLIKGIEQDELGMLLILQDAFKPDKFKACGDIVGLV